jgi:hypothetical protein
MKLVRSFFYLLISIALIILLFWGLTKFVPWFPTINRFFFYALTLFFIVTAYQLFTSTLRSTRSLKTIIKAVGYTGFQIFRIVIIIILLGACLIYLGQVVLANKDLYQNLRIVGLVAFALFSIQIALSFINQFLFPIND